MDETLRAPYQQQYLQVMAAACVLRERPTHDAPTADDQGIGASGGGGETSSSSSSSSSTVASRWFDAGLDDKSLGGKPFVPTPLNIFCTEKRSEVKALNPAASFDEIGELLHRQWNKMDKVARAIYFQRRRQLDDEELPLTAAADSSIPLLPGDVTISSDGHDLEPPVSKPATDKSKAKLNTTAATTVQPSRTVMPITNRLKPPPMGTPTPYNIFYSQKRRELAADEPEASVEEMTGKIGALSISLR